MFILHQQTVASVMPSAPTSAAGQQDSQSAFHPAGVWGPGVRMMRNMRFASKALLIYLIFMLTLAWVTVSYVNEKLAAIAFSSKELDGVAYNRAVFPLIEIAQQLRRDRVVKAVSGSESTESVQLQARLGEAQAALAEMERLHGQALGTGKAYAAVLATFCRPHVGPATPRPCSRHIRRT